MCASARAIALDVVIDKTLHVDRCSRAVQVASYNDLSMWIGHGMQIEHLVAERCTDKQRQPHNHTNRRIQERRRTLNSIVCTRVYSAHTEHCLLVRCQRFILDFFCCLSSVQDTQSHLHSFSYPIIKLTITIIRCVIAIRTRAPRDRLLYSFDVILIHTDIGRYARNVWYWRMEEIFTWQFVSVRWE